MEFTSEIAVLQSAIRFAASKLGNPIDISDTKDVERFTNLICPAVQEILDGLDDSRPTLDRSVWSLRLLSFLLTHLLRDVFSDMVRRQCSGEASPCGADNQHKQLLKPMHWSVNTVFQHVPCLSFPIFLELVKRFKWNGPFLECLEVIEESIAMAVISAILDLVCKWPTDVGSLQMVVTCQKYLMWLVVQSVSEKCELLTDVTVKVGAISKWLSDNLEEFDGQEVLVKIPTLVNELKHLTVLLSCMFINETSECDLRSIIAKSSTEKEVYPNEREATKVLISLEKAAKRQQTSDKGMFKVMLKQFQTSVPRTELVSLVSVMVQFAKDDSGESNLADDMTLDLGLVDIDMENIYQSLLDDLKKHGSEGDDKMSALMMFLTSVGTELSQKKVLKKEEDEKRQGEITLQGMLHKRLAGYEDCLHNILSCGDITTWQCERYVELLTENSDLLYGESHVRSLHLALKALAKVKGHDHILLSIQQILFGAFSQLPILTQEKIILDNFLSEDHPDLLSSIGNFHQERNVTFNQFTSEASEKQLLAVLRLCLIDPVSMLLHAVAAAIKSPGQIPVVLKIFHSVPDLCRCSYGNHHPERSLLCHVTSQYLLENSLSHQDQRNLMKFVTATVQSFTRHVCGYKIPEAAILSPAEFASAAILPFIGLPKSGDQTQPISIEFALKLFICLLEKKRDQDSDWLIGLQIQTLLLCICELLHECVELWDSSGHVMNKYGVKQLCLRCLHLLQTNYGKTSSQLHGKAADWLKARTKHLDWSVLIHLQKTLSWLGATQGMDYTVLVDNLAKHVAKHIGDASLPFLRFTCITEETLEAAKKSLCACNRVIPPDVLSTALTEILPHLLLSEWRRIVVCLVSVGECDRLSVPYRLMFNSKILLATSYDVKCLLSLTQLLTDVVMATSSDPSAPVAVVRHVATCYITVLQEQTKILNDTKDRSTEAFLIGQMFSHVTVAMTRMDTDQSEPLFVFLLSLLERYMDLQSRRVPKTKGRESVSYVDFQETDDNIVKAVLLLNDESKQETLLKKLFERKGEKCQ